MVESRSRCFAAERASDHGAVAEKLKLGQQEPSYSLSAIFVGLSAIILSLSAVFDSLSAIINELLPLPDFIWMNQTENTSDFPRDHHLFYKGDDVGPGNKNPPHSVMGRISHTG
ncbi:hypothetical protein [Planomicrobium sp. YIM 101495]|uniref:hypothetical protein n=1 Tax=Planomicrobium sp. YIM 101495 TaxID=2665160 RepID=UPI0012B79C40|nr:hypothetical protein [Planomicrobium sp. YIM 101495]MTD31913.1 hypothetical protein [Planomicrobium sp. YIM 101495]